MIAVAVGLWATQLSGDLDEARLALERERAAAAVLADPGARGVALEAGDGRLIVAEDGRAVLVLDGLDPAPAGKTYEMWIIEGETPGPGRHVRGGGRARRRARRREASKRVTASRSRSRMSRGRRADDDPIVASEPV